MSAKSDRGGCGCEAEHGGEPNLSGPVDVGLQCCAHAM